MIGDVEVPVPEKKEEKKKVIRNPLRWFFNGYDFEAPTVGKATENIQEFLNLHDDKFEGPVGMVYAFSPGSRHAQAYEIQQSIRLVRMPNCDYLKGTNADPEYQVSKAFDDLGEVEG